MIKKYFRKTPVFLLAIMATSLLFSCIPQKQTRYLQDLSSGKNYSKPDTITGITNRYFLHPNDYLFVRVNTPDPKISEFFNPSSSGSASGGQLSSRMFYYQIDDNMDIDFPFTGKINMKGCNLSMAKDRIIEALQPFLKEATVSVKLANANFTILGEVRKPGIQNMDKDQITIFEAIATAGDLSPFGKRKKVLLLRQTPQGEKTFTLDLTDKNIVNSEFYYVYPNDLIYVRPMKAKTWGVGESFSLGVISSTIALYLTLQAILK